MSGSAGRRPPLVIVGPTATGKSALALAVAERSEGRVEILSLDSMQVYRGMDIGTAKPSLAERARVPHHMIDLLDPDEVELPFDDLTFFEGMEPGDTRTLLARAGDLRVAFRRESAAFRDRWRRACLEARIEHRFVQTNESPAEVLRAFLAGRQKAAR